MRYFAMHNCIKSWRNSSVRRARNANNYGNNDNDRDNRYNTIA